jgi:hypothetical protein
MNLKAKLQVPIAGNKKLELSDFLRSFNLKTETCQTKCPWIISTIIHQWIGAAEETEGTPASLPPDLLHHTTAELWGMWHW